jgi:hypothetical protein
VCVPISFTRARTKSGSIKMTEGFSSLRRVG